MDEITVEIGDVRNILLDKIVMHLFVRIGKCNACHKSKPVLYMSVAMSPMLNGCICLDCILSGFTLYALKNKVAIPKLTYGDNPTKE